jgi:hypothetical protein
MYVYWAINAKRVARTKTVIVNAIATAALGWPRGSPGRSQRMPFNPASAVRWQLYSTTISRVLPKVPYRAVVTGNRIIDRRESRFR